MDMLSLIKQKIRISHNKLDDAIQSDIDACLLDLKRVGILHISEDGDDELINKLAELYVKGQIDYQGNGDRYTQAYEKMRDGLSMCGDYNAE